MCLVSVANSLVIWLPNHYDPLWTLSFPEDSICYMLSESHPLRTYMCLVFVANALVIWLPNHYDPLWTLSLPENSMCYLNPTPSAPICALYLWRMLQSFLFGLLPLSIFDARLCTQVSDYHPDNVQQSKLISGDLVGNVHQNRCTETRMVPNGTEWA